MSRFRYVLVLLMGRSLLAQDPSWRQQTPNFWPLWQRDAGFRAMEKVYPTKTVVASAKVHAFRKGKPLRLKLDIDAYIKFQRASGLLVIQGDSADATVLKGSDGDFETVCSHAVVSQVRELRL